MDIAGAVVQRRSIRSFKSQPVTQEVIKKILADAVRCPSWANTQPWEFAVAAGEPLAAIKQEFLARKAPPAFDVPSPSSFSAKYIERIKTLDKQNCLSTAEEWASRRVANFSLFGAPAVIYILVDRDFYYQQKGNNAWALYDCGAVAETIMLLALNYGLGTITLAQAVVHPDILRKVLAIPESRIFVIGIALGYPDFAHPLNRFRTEREPVENITRWYGF